MNEAPSELVIVSFSTISLRGIGGSGTVVSGPTTSQTAFDEMVVSNRAARAESPRTLNCLKVREYCHWLPDVNGNVKSAPGGPAGLSSLEQLNKEKRKPMKRLIAHFEIEVTRALQGLLFIRITPLVLVT